MRTAAYTAPGPSTDPPVVLAALQPRMLALAASDAAGTLTYFATSEHTRRARAALGTKWVCVEQAVMLETDASKARAAARAYMGFYVHGIPVYQQHLSSLGFGDTDFAGEMSDRLVDAIVAWGAEKQIRDRIDAHFHAGASHVCVLPLSPDGGHIPDRRVLEALAPG